MADCLPFDSINHDRVYKAEDWAWYFATFLSTGVFPKPSDGLKVVAYNKMEVKVNFGYAFINGRGFRNPKSKSIVLNTAHGALNRIDRIVIRWSAALRDIYITTIEGIPSARPTPAALTRNTEIWELAIADIYVEKGTTAIRAKDITDLRFNSSVCGIVKGTIEEIDASTITKQFEDYVAHYTQEKTAEFENWVNSIRETLETAENGKLLIELTDLLKNIYRQATDEDIDRIIAGTYVDEDEEGSIFEIASDQDIDDIIAGTYIEEDEIQEPGEDETEQQIVNIVNNTFN